MVAYKGISGLLGAVVPIVLVIAVIVVALKFQTDIGNFITKVTRTKEEKAFDDQKRLDEKRVQENGLFDNIVEFFFGKPTEDKPIDDKSVSKGDFDQNTDTQKEKSDREKRGKDQEQQIEKEKEVILDSRTQEQRDEQFQKLIDQAKAKQTVTVQKPRESVVVVKDSGSAKKPSNTFSSSAGGLVATLIGNSGSRISASSNGLVVTSGISTKSSSSSKGSSLGISDTIKATVIRGSPTQTKTSNLSNQSKALSAVTPKKPKATIQRGK